MSNHIICFSPSGATLGQRILAVEDVLLQTGNLHSVSEQITKVCRTGQSGFFSRATICFLSVRQESPYVRSRLMSGKNKAIRLWS